jgi:DnaJ-class molecular chaperone
METKADPYKILRVPPDAGFETIKSAYFRLAREYNDNPVMIVTSAEQYTLGSENAIAILQNNSSYQMMSHGCDNIISG